MQPKSGVPVAGDYYIKVSVCDVQQRPLVRPKTKCTEMIWSYTGAAVAHLFQRLILTICSKNKSLMELFLYLYVYQCRTSCSYIMITAQAVFDCTQERSNAIGLISTVIDKPFHTHSSQENFYHVNS